MPSIRRQKNSWWILPLIWRIQDSTIQKRTKRLHKELSLKQEGSKNQEKTRLKLAKHYDKICNRKKDWTHKIIRKLSDNYDLIILENLNIKGMQKFNSGLSKSALLDFSWHQFKTYLDYKMKWFRKNFLSVDRFFPSNKMWSKCGQKANDLTLKDRVRTCSSCGTTHDSDENASINLKAKGMRILKEEWNITIINTNDKTTVGTMGIRTFEEDVKHIEILKSYLGNFLWRNNLLHIRRSSSINHSIMNNYVNLEK